MSNVCRHADMGSTGHGCTSAIGVRATQRTVFANGTAVLRKGDPSFPHVIRVGKKCLGHSARINEGAPTVFVQGVPMARVGHSHDRGRMFQGSKNVFCGG